MFFIVSNNYGQCPTTYPTSFTTSQAGGNQTFCIDGTNPLTVTLTAQQYVILNVIKGYTYTFGVNDVWTATGNTNREYLGVYDNATNTRLTENNGTGGATISNWVSTLSGQVKILLLRGNSCTTTTSTTSGTLSMTLNSVGDNSTIDSQTAFGTGTWKGHIYNFTGATPPGGYPSPATISETTTPFITGSSANYAGYYDVGSEQFPTGFNFGGDDDTTCFNVYSEGNIRASILTHNFAVRYRMRSTRPAGCYVVKILGDDGVRLYINSKLVFDRWVQQSPTNYYYILVNLPANADLVFDYYENTGNNQVSFQIDPFDSTANIITAPATVNFCAGGDPAVIDGTFRYNDAGTEIDNPYINYQWQVSTNGSAYTNVPSNGNSRTYDPPAIPNATGSNIVTKYKRIATVNTTNAVGVTCTFNDSNEVTFITSPAAPATPGAISGTATQCPSLTGQVYSISPVANAISYNWTVPTGWSITSGAGTTSITVNTGTSGQNGNITVQAVNGCTPNAARSLPVTVSPSIGGTVSGSSIVCGGTNSTTFTLAGNTGNVIRWESSTDNFASVITPITNTTTTLNVTNISTTTYYRAVVQNGSCSITNSSVGSVVTKNPVATGVTICQGGSGSLTASTTCAAVSQTPITTSGSGGTSNATNYGGSGNTNISINFPALPVGAVVTGTNVTITYNTNGSSYLNELRVRATPPTAVGAVQSDLAPSTIGAGGTANNVFIGTWGTGIPTGNWLFEFRETYDDPSNPDANISNITITVNYTLPGTLDWYTVASGGTKIGSGSPFNPVNVTGSGLADTNTAGTTAYYVACSADPTCRTQVNFVINPSPVTPAISTTQPTCTVNTGTITVTAPSPAAGITYSIDGSTYTNTTGVFNNVAIGSYNVTVKNSTNCVSPATSVTINPPTAKTWNGSSSTIWNTAANWTPNGIPTSSDCVVIPTGVPQPVISTADAFAQILTVNNNASLSVQSSYTLNVVDGITVLGTGALVFENHSALMQSNTSPTINTGSITYKRIAVQIRRGDFVYWSTPVNPQKLFDVSPFTLSDKYFGFNGDNWVETNSNTTMVVGKGYIIRAPSSFSITAKADYPASFIGTPNNGDLSGETLVANKNYLIGNPYPSALDAKKFLGANLFLDGTLYFWTHNTPVNLSGVYQYDGNDYASYNLTGGTATSLPAPSGSIPGNDSRMPSGKIAAGQSFFASTNAGGTVTFNNLMRLPAADNTQFFKPGKTSKSTETNRLWLNMTNDDGLFKQMLIGYVEGATNEFENRYDGVSFDGNPYLDFYSVGNGNKYVIQGRALPFTDTDMVSLGYRSSVEGKFTISIDQVEGDLSNQDIYLEDKTTGKIHDLRSSNYTFTTAIGTFTDRFVLRYTNKTLGIGDVENPDNSILVSVKDKVVKVTSTKENIKQVTLFDVSGKQLYSKNKVSATELQLQNLPISNQVLLVNITLENGYVTTKKVILK
nr:T9SS sorting signal type C domain-containing protein [Flavobacterium sp. ASV13]